MQTLAQIKELLAARDARPKRSLGQNFLIDHNLIRKLVDAAGLAPGDVVLEVGPGTGTMSEELLERGVHLVACELDDVLADLLRERLGTHERFTLIHADCLDDKHTVSRRVMTALEAARLRQDPPHRVFHLVANLPYGAGTPLLSTLLVEHPECVTMAVTIQREVADRLLAGPGSKDFGPLAVLAQAIGTVERVAIAPPECFWPRPDVTSAMVLIRRRDASRTLNAGRLSEVCRVLFAQRRKQIGSVLARLPDQPGIHRALTSAGVSSTMRAEQLTVAQILQLAERLPLIDSTESTGPAAE